MLEGFHIFNSRSKNQTITNSSENLASMQGLVMENPMQACTDVHVFYRNFPLAVRYSEKGYNIQATGSFNVYAVANCDKEGRKVFKGSFVENRSGKICKGKAEADVLNYKRIYDDATCNVQKEREDKLFKHDFLSFSSKAFDALNLFIPACKNMNTAKCNLDSLLAESKYKFYEDSFDKYLNKFYQDIKAIVNSEVFSTLKQAQLQWINVRDAQENFTKVFYKRVYNDLNKASAYSSYYKTLSIYERSSLLKNYLDSKEGNNHASLYNDGIKYEIHEEMLKCLDTTTVGFDIVYCFYKASDKYQVEMEKLIASSKFSSEEKQLLNKNYEEWKKFVLLEKEFLNKFYNFEEHGTMGRFYAGAALADLHFSQYRLYYHFNTALN